MRSKLLLNIALLGLAAGLPCQGEIHTFADFTRAAGGASTTVTADFNPNEGWSGTPANTTAGENSLYLKATVSWTATTGNIGTFNIRFNGGDDAGAPRLGMGKNSNTMTSGNNAGFEFITANTTTDPDGAGPATARPAIVPFNANTVTSATLVMKIDHTKAGTSPGGDWWFATEGLQESAVGFIWINPNLAASEAGQFTPWAAWRSGNASYSGVSFITDTDAVALNFSNIAIYTGEDTPFATSSGIVDAATSTVSASPAAVPADGITTSTITVTLKDAGGSPVAGKEVSLAGNGSAFIETSNNTSDSGGVVTFTVKSNTPGTEQFTATDVTDGNLVITQTASVDFQEPVVVGPVSASNSTVVASPAAVVANDIATSTVTVTLKDSNGLLVIGEGVTLNGNPSGTSISPIGAQTTNGSGQAMFSVKSDTIGPVVFTATSVTDNVTITQTANVDFTDPLDAEAFNVNFLDEGQANASGLVGVVGGPGETWNQGNMTVNNLVDTTGTIVSSVNVAGLGNDGRVIGGGAQGVFTGNRGFFGKGQDTTISITGLTPDTAYDLYIYALSHSTTSWGNIADTERASGDFVTTNTVLGNGQSQWLDNGKAGTNGNTFVPNGNYVAFQSIVTNGSGNISILVDAYDGLPETNAGTTRLHVCGLQIRPASGASVDYAAWRNTSYPGLGQPDEDDDGDGLSNEYEHIFGLDPTDSASASPYTAPFDSETGYFGYSRRIQSLINMNYKVWYSTDLEAWFEDNAASQLPESVSNGVEDMGVEIDPALLGEPKLFVQVRATPITGIDPQPSLLNIRGSGNTITLIFSEPMNPSSAANPDNYNVVQDGVGTLSITGATLNPGGGSVTLTLASPLGIDTAYSVSADRVTSGTGQSLGVVTNRPFRTWDDDPAGVKVFILAGQSNMVGRGETERGNGDVAGAIGSLRYEVVTDNANYGNLVVNSGNPATDPWVVRSDVKLWWNRADIGAGAAVSKGGMTPVFGSGATTFGPEYGFGWAMGEHLSQPVLIIKTAWGGKDLITNFRPPGAVADPEGSGGVVGGYYIELLEQVREVLHNLGAEFPEWNGLGYQIAGFGWHQGWNDGGSTVAADEYEANMAHFITDIRAEFAKPALPFSIGTTGMVGAGTSGNLLKVVNAQINVANPTLHPELGGNVFTVDTRPFARETAESPTNDTTHWKNNGESMYLIGKGMGDGMVDLIAP